jgi:hypothetical protein
MCTVTIVPKPGLKHAFRMACNRDERHGRVAASPPTNNGKKDHPADLSVLMPIDPVSGGTWVAVNEAGIALTLLNYNLPDPPTDRDASRGGVIPLLAQCRTIDEALKLAERVERDRMMPFRLVICDGRSLVLWRSTEAIDSAEVSTWSGRPVMYTSSGLGDQVVEGPRRELFDRWFGGDVNENLDKQRAFHQHRWPSREHLSIDMHREDARTVSYTVVDVESATATMRYYADGPSQAEPTATHTATIYPR